MEYKFARVNNESIHSWYSRISNQRARGGPPDSLEHELQQFQSDSSKSELLLTLVSDFQLRGNYQAAENLIQAEIELDPRDPRMRLLMVSHYFYNSEEFDKALNASNEALSEARKSGMFIREVHGVRARIALKTNDNKLLRQSVQEIIDLGLMPNAIDVGMERDFVDRAPSGVISDETKQQFESLYQDYWA